MDEKTVRVTKSPRCLTATIHRPAVRNSINAQLIYDLHEALDEAEQDTSCRFFVLQGERDYFCTGMDFQELTNAKNDEAPTQTAFSLDDYMRFLKRLTLTPKIIISLLDGQVLAGGVGFVAASDIVISTSRTQFGLSEALWGLLPACVTPFLIRRIGFQKAYWMTLTTQTVLAAEAHKWGLVDELNDKPEESLRRTMLRLSRLQEETVFDLKAYFRKMWILTEAMENAAVTEIDRLVAKPQVHANIKNFIESGQFPWEHATKGEKG